MCDMSAKWFNFYELPNMWSQRGLQNYNRELVTKFGIIRRNVDMQRALEELREAVAEEANNLELREGLEEKNPDISPCTKTASGTTSVALEGSTSSSLLQGLALIALICLALLLIWKYLTAPAAVIEPQPSIRIPDGSPAWVAILFTIENFLSGNFLV